MAERVQEIAPLTLEAARIELRSKAIRGSPNECLGWAWESRAMRLFSRLDSERLDTKI